MFNFLLNTPLETDRIMFAIAILLRRARNISNAGYEPYSRLFHHLIFPPDQTVKIEDDLKAWIDGFYHSLDGGTRFPSPHPADKEDGLPMLDGSMGNYMHFFSDMLIRTLCAKYNVPAPMKPLHDGHVFALAAVLSPYEGMPGFVNQDVVVELTASIHLPKQRRLKPQGKTK